jgi:Cu-Zn family superoxide dismutase
MVGDALLRQTPNGVLLTVHLRDLPPGIHGFHIHETGRCEPPTFESSSGHFDAAGRKHGIFDAAGPHAGDLPNVHVPEGGKVSLEYFVGGVSLDAGRTSSLLGGDGAALVMHRGADDYRTDPAGGAGDRIACGVIMR